MLLAHPGPTRPVPAPMAGALGFGVGIVVTPAAALLGARDAPLLGLALLAATAAAIAATTTIGGALAAAASCWALWNGFLLNDLGLLTFDTGGLRGLVAITAPAVVAAVLATVVNTWRRPRPALDGSRWRGPTRVVRARSGPGRRSEWPAETSRRRVGRRASGTVGGGGYRRRRTRFTRTRRSRRSEPDAVGDGGGHRRR